MTKLSERICYLSGKPCLTVHCCQHDPELDLCKCVLDRPAPADLGIAPNRRTKEQVQKDHERKV